MLAGREPPDAGWSADPGWRQLLRRLDLACMPPAESVELLARLGVPADQRGRLAALGRGHPLTLTLLAEACAGGSCRPGSTSFRNWSPSCAGCWSARFRTPTTAPGWRPAPHAYRTTEDLLAATVGRRAPEVWAWLSARPFVGRSGDGLYLHDLVRDVFDAEFAQRNPDAYVALHRTMRQHAVSRLFDPTSLSRHRDAIELMLLHQRSPLEPQVRQLRDTGVLAMVPAAPADRAGVLELVAGTEGPEAAEIYGRWIEAQPDGLYAARSETGVEAFALHVYVSPEDNPVPEDPGRPGRAGRDRAPVSRCAPGERVGICRAIGNRGTYGRDALAVLAGSVSSLVEWLSRPIAWTVVTAPYEDFWRPFFEYLGFGVLARVPFGGGDVTAYGWDRRRLPLEEFLELTGRRELTGETGPPPAELLRPAPMRPGSVRGGGPGRAARRSTARTGWPPAALAGTALAS